MNDTKKRLLWWLTLITALWKNGRLRLNQLIRNLDWTFEFHKWLSDVSPRISLLISRNWYNTHLLTRKVSTVRTHTGTELGRHSAWRSPSGARQSAFSAHQYMGVHYSDVTMSIMASQIPGDYIVCLSFCLDEHQRKHQSPRDYLIVRGIHR